MRGACSACIWSPARAGGQRRGCVYVSVAPPLFVDRIDHTHVPAFNATGSAAGRS